MKIGEYKCPVGLIRAEVQIENSKIAKVTFTGDFFLYPEERLSDLEQFLKGTSVKEEELKGKVRAFYRRFEMETPLLEPKHWVEAILRALK